MIRVGSIISHHHRKPMTFLSLFGSRYKTTRAVMSFGDGTQGALGLPTHLNGHASDAYEPTPIPGLPEDITRLGAGHYHSLAVTSSGQLWAWGRDQEGQLGRGSVSSRDTWNEPMRVKGLDEVQVVEASGSGVVSAAIGDDGSLWVWGSSKRGQLGLGKGIFEAVVPSRVDALVGEKIVKVSFGWGHSLALTEDGKLFGWGYSADGRIGKVGGVENVSLLDTSAGSSSGDIEVAERIVLEGMEKEKDMPIVWEPCLVKELDGSKVVAVACGLDHSLVLCSDGRLLSSGSNAYGQLGRKNPDIGLFPVEASMNPLSIASGLGHSLAIYLLASSEAEENSTRALSWGWNQQFQLGRQGPENEPLEVKGLRGENLVSVSGGRVHSVALTTKGQVWTWGCGKNGRLGLGSSIDEAEPVLLDSIGDCEVLQAVSGFDHSLVLIDQ